VPATRRLLTRCGVGAADLDLVEFNEAFAAQVLACLDALAIPEDKVCIGGGALALGHPFGASGAVLVVRLFSEIIRHPAASPASRRGLAVLGIGGGMGVASLWEASSP
jgi:acetyl-CoA C-acetyltransferase